MIAPASYAPLSEYPLHETSIIPFIRPIDRPMNRIPIRVLRARNIYTRYNEICPPEIKQGVT